MRNGRWGLTRATPARSNGDVRHRRATLAVIAMLVALAIAPPVFAQHEPDAGAADADAKPTAAVVLHDRRVFGVRAARAGLTAEQRAQAASRALQQVIDEAGEPEVRVEEQGDVQVVFVGSTPIIQLGGEDAELAGDASLALHAAAVAGKTRDAVRAERQRSAIARSVFSFSLLVFSGLITFLLLGKLGELFERLRAFVERPERVPALRIRDIEVVRPAAVRGGIEVTLTITKRLTQVGVVYGWVIFGLSLFEATRGYTERLTGFVLKPVSELMGRVASALPLLVIAIITAAVMGGVLRFVRLFFGSVARGETTLGWLPQDLAPATSVLVRAGVVVITVVVASPLITGTDDGALARAGAVALGAIGLSSTPLLATAAVGIAAMFGRRIRVGEHVVVGGRAGRVRETTLLEVVLDDEDGAAVHVPHLAMLWHPTRVLGPSPSLVVEITVAASADLLLAAGALERAAATVGERPRVDLEALTAAGARFRVRVEPERAAGARHRLLAAVAAALQKEGIALGGAGP